MTEPISLKLEPRALGELFREALGVGLFALAASTTAVLALFLRTPRERSFQQLGLAALLIALGGAVALLLDWRRRRFFLSGWQGSLEADRLRVATVRGTRSLERRALKRIVATTWPARGLVLTAAGEPPLFLPASLERFEAAKALLSAWAPIESSRVPAWVARAWPLVIVAVCGLEALALSSTHPALTGGASLVLAGIALFSLANALRSHRLSLRARVLSLLLLVPVAYLLLHTWRTLR